PAESSPETYKLLSRYTVRFSNPPGYPGTRVPAECAIQSAAERGTLASERAKSIHPALLILFALGGSSGTVRCRVAVKDAVHLQQPARLSVGESRLQCDELVALLAQLLEHSVKRDVSLVQWDQRHLYLNGVDESKAA